MNNTIETLFTQALGLQAPWVVHEVKLDTAARRIDFEIACQTRHLDCPGSGFTALFEALALTLCRDVPVRQAAALLRCQDKQLWRRIEQAMNAQLQLAKRAARGFRTSKNFIAIAYLRMSKIKHLPASPLRPAAL